MGGINSIFDYNYNLSQQQARQQVVKPVEKVNEVAKTAIRVKPTFQELLDGYRNPKKEEPEEEKEVATQKVDTTSIAASMAAMDYLISISKKKEEKK